MITNTKRSQNLMDSVLVNQSFLFRTFKKILNLRNEKFNIVYVIIFSVK